MGGRCAKLITGDDEFSGSAAAVLVYVSVSNNKCHCTDCWKCKDKSKVRKGKTFRMRGIKCCKMTGCVFPFVCQEWDQEVSQVFCKKFCVAGITQYCWQPGRNCWKLAWFKQAVKSSYKNVLFAENIDGNWTLRNFVHANSCPEMYEVSEA